MGNKATKPSPARKKDAVPAFDIATSLHKDGTRLLMCGLKLVELPVQLSEFPSLTDLSLANNKIASLSVLTTLPNLTRLDLSENKLSRHLPLHLSELHSLTELDLGNNSIAQDIFDSLASLPNLQTLGAERNHLTDVPNSILSIPTLTTLKLGFNKIQSIPSSIVSLSQLNTIRLSGNSIARIEGAIFSLPNLKSFICNRAHVRSIEIELPSSSQTKLEELHLASNLIESLPETFYRLTSLTSLDLSCNALTAISADIGQLTSLTYLSLSDNKLTQLPGTMDNLTELKNLNVSFNSLSALEAVPDSLESLDACRNHISVLPPSFQNLLHLTGLSLSANHLDASVDLSVIRSPVIMSLKLAENDLTDESIAPLGSLTTLVTLDLSMNHLNVLPTFLDKLTNLRNCLLDGNRISNISEEQYLSLPSSLNRLQLNHNGIGQHQIAKFESMTELTLARPRIMVENSVPSLIMDGLYLSDMNVAINRTILTEYKITHIVVVASGIRPRFAKEITYLLIDIEDTDEADIFQHFEHTARFIDSARAAGGTCLVHCRAGISRSASVVIAYLMQLNRLPFETALKTVATCRRIVCPNLGFREQLKKYELHLGLDVNTASTN